MRDDLAPDEFSQALDEVRAHLGLPPKPGWW